MVAMLVASYFVSSLQLVLFDGVAKPARGWTRRTHHPTICIARSIKCPRRTFRLRVHTHRCASATRFRTQWYDCERIFSTLLLVPYCTLRAIRVRTNDIITNSTGVGTLSHHCVRIFVTLAVRCPSGAVVMQVHTGSSANATRPRTVHVHEIRIHVTVTSSTPFCTVVLTIVTTSRAYSTTCGTSTQHIRRICDAFTVGCPILAMKFSVPAPMSAVSRTNVTRMRTLDGHEFHVCDALIVLCPIRTRSMFVVTKPPGVCHQTEASDDQQYAKHLFCVR